VDEGGTVALSAAQLQATDSDNAPAELLFTLTAAPAHGALLKSGGALAVGGTFTQAELDAGGLSYTHDGGETAADSFNFTVGDGSATTAAAAFVLTVKPINDPPTAAVNAGLTLDQGATMALTTAVLQTVDVDNGAAQLRYTLTAVPAHGAVKLSGLALAVGAAFTQADVDGGLVSYQHDDTETRSDSFAFAAGDGTATLPAATFALTVNNVIGPPAKLAFQTQPADLVAGQPLPALVVLVQDIAGDTVPTATDEVSLTLATGTLVGGARLAAVAGVATFDGLSVELAGAGYTLVASSGTLAAATSQPFAVSPAAAAKLVFTGQPTNAIAGAALSPAVEVTIQDTYGNTVTSATDEVALALPAGYDGCSLAGPATAAAVAGVAKFDALTLPKVRAGYLLEATGAGFAVTSAAFDISPAPAVALAFVTAPSTVASGVAMTPPPVRPPTSAWRCLPALP
jgi:hypothetical protein